MSQQDSPINYDAPLRVMNAAAVMAEDYLGKAGEVGGTSIPIENARVAAELCEVMVKSSMTVMHLVHAQEKVDER